MNTDILMKFWCTDGIVLVLICAIAYIICGRASEKAMKCLAVLAGICGFAFLVVVIWIIWAT